MSRRPRQLRAIANLELRAPQPQVLEVKTGCEVDWLFWTAPIVNL
jgi:hypothetical protein